MKIPTKELFINLGAKEWSYDWKGLYFYFFEELCYMNSKVSGGVLKKKRESYFPEE